MTAPVAIVQARVGSTRLPGKVLVDVAGKPILARVVERARRASRVARVGIATTHRPADDAIVRLAGELDCPCFRGSEDDVLDRYHGAAACFDADPVIRITSDCPLLDPALVNASIETYLAAGGALDYVGFDPRFPDGLDHEVVARAALDRAWREARLPSEREHVTPYIYKHPELFRVTTNRSPRDLSHHRWTVDDERDLRLVREVYARLGDGPFGLEEVLALMTAHPEIAAINRETVRNEGYLKSIAADPRT